MILHLIRHGKSTANKERRYSGQMDVILIKEAKDELLKISYPMPDLLFTSSLKRCVETATIIYPEKHIERKMDCFKEIDFGDWAGKKHEELKDDNNYYAWLNNPYEINIPNGENYDDFSKRVLGCLNIILDKYNSKHVSIVTHGGVIALILKEFLNGDKEFHDYIIKNGEGVTIHFENKKIKYYEFIREETK